MADTSLSEKKIGLLIWQVSNYWQSKLRRILKKYDLTLNEYLILESIQYLSKTKNKLYQIDVSVFSGIDISVSSVTFKLLEKKKLINRNIEDDNRKKIIKMLSQGYYLYNEINPIILKEESIIFGKLQNETNYFKNILKLLLGKSLRVRAEKIL